MLILVLLLTAGGLHNECAIDRASQLEIIGAMQEEFDAHVQQLIFLGVPPAKAVDLAHSDPEGIRLEASYRCMDTFASWQNSRAHASEAHAVNNTWDTIASHAVSGLVALSVALFAAYFTIRRSIYKDAEKTLSASKHTVCESLNAIDSTLKKTRGYNYTVLIRGRPTEIRVSYVNQKFSTVPLESIINSGSFAFLPVSLQAMIDSLYFEISEHNDKFSMIEGIALQSKIEGAHHQAGEAALDLMMALAVIERRLKKLVDKYRHDLMGL